MSTEHVPYLLLRVALWPFEDAEPLAASEATRLLDLRSELASTLEERAEALNPRLFEAAGPPDPEAGKEAAHQRLAVVALRRDVFNRRPLEPETLARAAPRLGAELTAQVQRWEEQRRDGEALGERAREAFRGELAAARRHLLERTRRDAFRLALRLVSRPLVRDLERLPDPREDGDAWRHDERHTAASLAAYLGRAVSKTSPQGLFAGTAPAGWLADGSRRAVAGSHRPAGGPLPRRDLLLHVVEARKATATLGSVEEPATWPVIEARVNPTLHEDEDPAGGEPTWWLWRPASLADDDLRPVLRRMKPHPVARVLLELARRAPPGRPRSLADLLTAGVEATGLARGELAPFLTRLARAGLFPREVELPYTTRRPLAELASRMRAAGIGEEEAPWLLAVRQVEEGVERAATEPPADALASLDTLTEAVDGLPHRRPLATDDLFRLDAASELTIALPRSVRGDLHAAVEDYARLAAALYPRPALTRALARRFLDAFEADREVPALEVYRLLEVARDPPADRAAGTAADPRLAFPPPLPPDARRSAGPDPPATRAYESAHLAFVAAARQARAEGRSEVGWGELEQMGLAKPGLAKPGAKLGEAEEATGGVGAEPRWLAAVNFQVAAEDAAAVAEGRYRLVLNDLFTGVGLALSRFAHLHAPSEPGTPNPIVSELRHHLEGLRRTSAPREGELPVVAEVTFNHWGPAANAGLRPPFLEHEIELPGQRASPGATVLPLTALTLRWDSTEECMVLTWHPADGRLARQVLPVLTSGVAPEGFASLLVGIGRQALQPLTLFPGFPPPDVDQPFAWPRIVHGRVVLMRRRWYFPPGHPPEPPRDRGDPDELLARFFARVHGWRRSHGLPRHVFVRTNLEPKPFWVDLESPAAVDLLRRLLSSPGPAGDAGATPPRRDLHVEEMLPGPGEMWVRDGEGRYAAELLLQMGRV